MRASFLLLAFLLGACARESGDASQQSPPEATTVAGNTATAPSNTVNPPMPQEKDDPTNRPAPASPMQDVQLIEYAIRMPESVPAGTVVFNVANAGKEDHGFEIEGPGLETTTQLLKRGDTAALEVNLKPGTYTAYCPVKGHREKGMRTTVVVR